MSEVEKAARKAFQVVYHRYSECDRAWVETEDGPEGIPVKKVGWREGFAEVVKLDEDGGVRVAGGWGRDDRLQKGRKSGNEDEVPAAAEEGTGNGVSRRTRMRPGNNCDRAKNDDRPAVEKAPRGPCMSSGNLGDRAKLDDGSAEESAPRGAQAGGPLETDATCERNGVEAEDTTLYSLDEVPDEITREWWQKYKHNFYFKGNRMMLKKIY